MKAIDEVREIYDGHHTSDVYMHQVWEFVKILARRIDELEQKQKIHML